MSGLTHITGGLLIGSAILYYADTGDSELTATIANTFLAGCTLGALACDADEPNSLIGHVLWPIPRLFYIINRIFYILAWLLPRKTALRRNVSDIALAFSHRGLMHWPSTILFFNIILYLLVSIAVPYINSTETIKILNSLVLGISTGMFSHLLYDFPSGTLCLLAPFSRKKIGLKLIESNGFIDKYIIRTLNLAGGVYFLACK